MIDITLDARDLQCPFPVLKARKLLKGMKTGQVLEVLATDPGASEDFAAFCEATNCDLLEWHETSGVFRFLIRTNG